MKNISKKVAFFFILISSVILLQSLQPYIVEAQTNRRIKFAKGSSSAIINGRIGTGSRICYFLKARQGQKLSAKVSSANRKVMIFESGYPVWEYMIEVDGDVSVCLDNYSKSTFYKLEVSIN
jgi:hypothetical protein